MTYDQWKTRDPNEPFAEHEEEQMPMPTEPPANLPDGWEYQAETNSVICGGCSFRFGAEHPDGDEKWTCPNCGDGNANPLSPEMDRLASIWSEFATRRYVRRDYPLLAEAIDKLVKGSRS